MQIEFKQTAEELLNKMITRNDCFATQNSDGTYKKIERPLTIDEILKHLSGEHTIGIYQISDSDEVKFLCLDLDIRKAQITNGQLTDEQKHMLQSASKNLHHASEQIGLYPAIEFSGRRGYHLLYFFDKPVKAIEARRLADVIKEKAGTLPVDLDIEVFPKQDKRAAYGCMLKLPLGIHKKTGQRSIFVRPDNFHAIEDAQDLLQTASTISTEEIMRLVGNVEPKMNRKVPVGSSLELHQAGLEKMVKNCPVIQLFEAHPELFTYDSWLGVGSNYIVFKGGWEKFVEVSKRDKAKFSQHEIDRIQAEILDSFHGPQGYDVFRSQGIEFDLPDNPPAAPAGYGSRRDPIQSSIVEQNGCYGKLAKEGAFEMLTPFIIEPNELLMLPDGDVLTCAIKHTSGQKWESVTIENCDWFTRGKFMKALGHSECTFHGSDLQLIDVCQHVVSQVKLRKQGTRVIGLQDDLWVIKNANISVAGYIDPMTIIPYDRSADSLHGRVQYRHLEDDAYKALVSTFFDNILNVNMPEVILPVLGWFFSAPLKPRIMQAVGSFPILFCYGAPGSGKTSFLETMLTMHGFQDPTVYSCTMKPFPMLKLLCSTNAVPIVLDEYKPYDMRDFQVADIGRLIRKIYRGEIEDKGTGDQGVIHYSLQAPLVVCGESKVKETAVLERVIIAGFTDEIKRKPNMQTAFKSINALDLTAFMDRYIAFCLSVDVQAGMDKAEGKVHAVLAGSTLAPRVTYNLATMVFGLDLMQEFALQWGIDLSSRIDLSAVLNNQIEEISGNDTGQVRYACDLLLEQLAIMVEKDLLERCIDYTHVKLREGDNFKTYLAIHTKTAVQSFRANIRLLGYDGELLDDQAYLKQFKTRNYVKATNHTVRFANNHLSNQKKTKKCLLIDVDKAKAIGLELSGFDGSDWIGTDDQTQDEM